METKHATSWAAALAAAYLFGSMHRANAAPWTMPAGEAEHFSYANGQDLNGIFGDPYVSGDAFIFPDFSQSVAAEDGATDARGDTVSVDLFANTGWKYGLMRITLFGSYAAMGDASVDFDGGLSFDELEPPSRHWNGPINTNPIFPRFNAEGGWSGLAVVDITFEFPNPSDAMHLEFSTHALAITGPGGSASLDVHGQSRGGFELEISMIQIPEPSSLALISCLAGLAIGRREPARSTQMRFIRY